MNKLKIGTRIYNHGDMANNPKFGVIVQVKEKPYELGYMVRYDGEESLQFAPSCMFSEEFKGNGSTRFVTEEAYETFRTKENERLYNYFNKKEV